MDLPPKDDDLNGLKLDRELSRKLYYTWTPFFSQFSRLTQVQRQAIPPILEGKDTLVCSPTATGKTEAVCAPLLERNFLSSSPWKVLYISPTRALVNDLYFRLINPVEQLGFQISRYTGDYHQNLEVAKVVLTTPESFDSILCRGKIYRGHVLMDVTALVFDEIHFLVGTPRGEQLRWLIQRLLLLKRDAVRRAWISDESLQRLALSATISNHEKIIHDFLDPENAHFIYVSGGRRIDVVCPDESSPITEESLINYLKASRTPEKVLVFCNARKRVDHLLDKLKSTLGKIGYIGVAHHGSLSKALREEAEETIKTEKKVVMFATSTLEIGVDIGDIDLVVLDGPAPDVSSFLQRIGRGNRRTNSTRVMPCFGSIAESIIQNAIIHSARSNRLYVDHLGPCHAVAVQQVASYVFQSPRRSRNKQKLETLLKLCAHSTVHECIIEHLLGIGELLDDGDGVRLNERWLNRSERGDLHSNIESVPGVTLVDEDTGKALATGLNVREGKILRLAGKLMEIKKWEGAKVYVGRLKERVKPDAVWGYNTKSWVKGAGQPQAVRDYLGLKENEWPILHMGDESQIFHFGGATRKAVIELIVENNPEARDFISANEWYLKLRGHISNKPNFLQEVSANTVVLLAHQKIQTLETILARPHSNRLLPMGPRIHEVLEWLNVGGEVKTVRESIWKPATDNDLIFTLQSLL